MGTDETQMGRDFDANCANFRELILNHGWTRVSTDKKYLAGMGLRMVIRASCAIVVRAKLLGTLDFIRANLRNWRHCPFFFICVSSVQICGSKN